MAASKIRHLLKACGQISWRALIASSFVTTLCIIITSFALPDRSAKFKDRVNDAFASGLIPIPTIWVDYLFNECVILSFLVVDYTSKFAEALPLRPIIGCDNLFHYLNGAKVEIDFYNRYLNG